MKEHPILFSDNDEPLKRPVKWRGGKKEADRRYREKNAEKRRAYNREWYARNAQREREKQSLYRKTNKDKINEANRIWRKKHATELRKEMIEAYGGKCCCCGETEPIFMQLDHINNDGNIERRRHGNHIVEWRELKKAGWPKDNHQLLCANCNHGKRMNNGICPHKTKINEN